jgi:ATP synthase protein I
LSETDRENGTTPGRRLDDEVGEIVRKADRKRRALEREHRSPLYGIGMFGLIGWSVALPIVVGTALGLWIDARWPSQQSWTLILLIAGAFLGSANAWYWIQRETRDD